MASAVVALAFGAAPALAVTAGLQPFGACNTATDCTTGAGHASVSVTSTLTINEQRAISFGNIKAGATATSDSIVLSLAGGRTASGFTLLNGASGGGFTGAGTDTGGQSPGHYTIEGGNEDAGSATQVYISFADTSGKVIDISGDNYHPPGAAGLNQITLNGPGGKKLYMDSFVINETGSDAYGHYITNANSSSVASPGISNPFDHAHATASGAGVADVVVGATLHGSGDTLGVGKYTGNFDIMASY
jgi:hypothetical protein